jgi:hypothetical protein
LRAPRRAPPPPPHAPITSLISIAAVTFKAEVRKKLSLAPNATSKEAVWSNHIRALNVEQIKAWAAPDGHILWTLANHGWLDFTLNWVATVTRSGVQNFFVATLDDK